uniref:VWFA domain-containing protein n=1 Tax=Acanthochromis polyacanthus TaxID=80966 RepID=A0A3Q1GER9_9TELE
VKRTISNVADIVFIVDESGSIKEANFQLMRTFLSSIISGLEVGLARVRLGIVTYNEMQTAQLYLNTFQTKTDILQLINFMPYSGGGTNTGAALDFTLKNIFNEKRGSRKGVQKVAVVVTDGKSQDSVVVPAATLRRAGVTVYAVGIKDANEAELREMATSPPEKHVFIVDSFTQLKSLEQTLQKSLCRNIIEDAITSVDSKTDIKEGLENEKYYLYLGFCVIPEYFQFYRWLTIDTPFIECKRANVADIVFIVDESGSIKEANFQLMRTFLSSIISGLEVGLARVRLGIVTYNEMQTAQLYLNTFQTKTDILQLINFMPYSGGGTNTGAALDFTLKNIFNEKRGSRKGVQKVAVVVTDGKSQDSVVVPAATLRRAGVTVYAVGIKDANEAELREMATSPPEKHVFIVDSFTQLKSLEQTLQKSLCRNIIEDAITSVDMQTEKICFRQERDTIFKMAAKTLKLTKLDAKCTNTHKHGESIQRHKLSQN